MGNRLVRDMLRLDGIERDSKQPLGYPPLNAHLDFWKALENTNYRRRLLNFKPEKKLYNQLLCPEPSLGGQIVLNENDTIMDDLSPNRRLNEIKRAEKKNELMVKSQYGLKRQKKGKKKRRK